jgi:hypothetical protein
MAITIVVPPGPSGRLCRVPTTGVDVRAQRQEVARLSRIALDRPRWQQVLAFGVSLWALAWIAAQFLAPHRAPTALGVLSDLVVRLGVTGAWTERLADTWQDGGGALPILGGLLWAATSERGQTPALFGWIAVMLGSERLGYQPAILLALGTMVAFVALLWLASLTRAGIVDRRTTLLPRDVVRAGVTAATLSAVVPLFAPCYFVARIVRPYLTRAPRILDRKTRRTSEQPPDEDRSDS